MESEKCKSLSDITNLAQIAAHLEAEIEAFYIVFSSLKAENSRNHQVLQRYGELTLHDPYAALHRDTQINGLCSESTCIQHASNVMQKPLLFIEELVNTHKNSISNISNQLVQLENRYQKALQDLEEEKNKRAQEQAVGDDVTYLLEKEREKLKQQIDFERQSTKKLEKDHSRVQQSLTEERSKYQRLYIALVTERKKLILKLCQEKIQLEQADARNAELSNKVDLLTAESANQARAAQTTEAELERRVSTFEFEKHQLNGKLARSEKQVHNLHEEVERLKNRIYELELGRFSSSDAPEIVESRPPLSHPQRNRPKTSRPIQCHEYDEVCVNGTAVLPHDDGNSNHRISENVVQNPLQVSTVASKTLDYTSRTVKVRQSEQIPDESSTRIPQLSVKSPAVLNSSSIHSSSHKPIANLRSFGSHKPIAAKPEPPLRTSSALSAARFEMQN